MIDQRSAKVPSAHWRDPKAKDPQTAPLLSLGTLGLKFACDPTGLPMMVQYREEKKPQGKSQDTTATKKHTHG
ncbi:MAG: hypothetical protein ACK456_12210 [Pseudanabaenaceae cyanobacterium]